MLSIEEFIPLFVASAVFFIALIIYNLTGSKDKKVALAVSAGPVGERAEPVIADIPEDDSEDDSEEESIASPEWPKGNQTCQGYYK